MYRSTSLGLTGVLLYIIDCHFDNMDNDNSLKRIEDKIDLLLLQENKPADPLRNKGKHQEIVQCIQKNAQDIGAVALIELMDIIPELRSMIDN
jgi:hypothetical protein